MKQPQNAIAGNGFVMWSSDGRRAPVVQALSHLTGRGTGNQDYAFRFSQASQLPSYMSRRVDATVAKFMYAVTESYVRGMAAPLLTVGGALVQHGSGNSSGRWLNNKWYLQGTEAAHFGIGTLTLHSDAVSIAGLKRVRDVATAHGIQYPDIHSELSANGQLVAYGLVNDAATFLAPAYFNQTEGVQERRKQHLMHGLLDVAVPRGGEQLEAQLIRTGDRVVNFLVEKRAVAIDPIDDRLTAIRRGRDVNEYKQDPDDRLNLVFSGEEHLALEAMRAQLTARQGELFANIGQIERAIPQRAQWLVELAEEAKAEAAT
jgi:hypothetical protein